jgi:hypothetical protein
MKMYLYLSSVISLYRDKRCHNHHQLDKPKSNDGGVLPLSFYWPCLFRWNFLAYADAYADLLWEKNTVRSLTSTAKIVLQS